MTDEERLSREALVKRAAVAAGAVYAAPVLTSVSHAGPDAKAGACPSCGNATKCCDVLNSCGGNCGCFLVFEDRSRRACIELRGGLCASFPSCTSQAECGAGQCCVCTCCHEAVGRRSACQGCVGICGQQCSGSSRPTRGARTGAKLYV